MPPPILGRAALAQARVLNEARRTGVDERSKGMQVVNRGKRRTRSEVEKRITEIIGWTEREKKKKQ